MVVRITTKIEEAQEDIEKGIVLPSIKLGVVVKYGYCKIDNKNKVSTHYIVDYKCNDICILPSTNNGDDVNISITSDNFIRFWTSNVRRYLKWDYDDKRDVLYLKSYRREEK